MTDIEVQTRRAFFFFFFSAPAPRPGNKRARCTALYSQLDLVGDSFLAQAATAVAIATAVRAFPQKEPMPYRRGLGLTGHRTAAEPRRQRK